MRALVFERYGAPERLMPRTLPIPQPRAGELRVRVVATTVTRTDTATLRGHPFFARAMTGILRPKMRTLGMDFAGVVDATGPDVARFQPGDRVFGLLPERFGAHAEYLCIDSEAAVMPMPANLDFDACVVGEGAWYANGTTRVLREGQRCLIYGASGAIGTAAIQLAKARGAHVTAVVGHRHVDLARSLGADRTIDYQSVDFTALDETFDLVFDAAGKTSWFACRRLLSRGGIFSATDLGPWWSNLVLSAWFSMTGSARVRIPFPEDARGFLASLATLMADGRFRGVFDRHYRLAEMVDAFRYVETGQKTGIVVVDVNDS
ncbi:MAG: NAD(P)-dependent alcohol dehydrogenase [Burkholderiaceae bacterium]|nr:NAD(P)-dependent alcohol dehydrogenase [Burkholderiaceae bacterium]